MEKNLTSKQYVTGMIYGIGRNYEAHARELGNETPKTDPIVFLKPPAAVVGSGQRVRLPLFSTQVHFEVELAFLFGSRLEPEAFTVAIDLTARDKQREAQDKKGPWGLAKGFKQSCQLGPWVLTSNVDLQNLELKLLLNGSLKQQGFTKDMIFSVKDLACYLIEAFPIQPGDVVLTGTPEGVGPVKAGDRIDAEIVGYCQAFWFYE